MVARIDPRIENMSGSRQFDCNSLVIIVIGRSGHKTYSHDVTMGRITQKVNREQVFLSL